MTNNQTQEGLSMNRTGEEKGLPKRMSRFTRRDGYWYYSTREGIDIGPFDSKHEAESGARGFIDFITHAEPQVISSLSKYKPAA